MNEHLTAIGPALANHLWQTTAFIAAVWLTTLALKKNQARVRYALWLAASLKFLLPFSLLIALGSMLPRPQQAVAAPAVYATVDEVAQPFSQVDATPMPAAPVPTLLERVEARVPMTLAAIWLCGLVLLLALWGARWLQVWRTLRRASRTVSGREFDLLRHVERAGCPTHAVSSHGWGRARRPIPLRLSRELMEPGIFGAFRPVLIWPEQLSAHLDDEHIEAILIHELAHARRRDNLTAALHMFVQAVFWFHPLVWWMERCMIEEREHACDEAVVAIGSRPGIYAESLLRACRFCIESPLTCVAGITGADLCDRIVQIMTARISRKLTTANKLLLLSAALFIVAVPIVLGQAQAAVRIEAMAVKMTPAPIRAAAQMMIAATQAPPPVEPSSVQQTTDDKASAADPCTVNPGATFDVVSIRPSKAGAGDWDSESTADGVNSSGSLRNLIEEAYGLRDFQIAGGPDWMVTQTFDIKAKFDNPDKPGSMAAQKAINRRWAERYQSLLIDRFHFKCHMTMQELPVYDLVVAKHGMKMKRATAEESNSNSTEIQSNRQGFHALGVGVTMQGLVALFARSAGRAIVDKTGLTGSYDFTLNWAAANRRATQDADGGVPLPELPEALEEQLGLKLVASKGPVPVMVVDHVDKPELEGAEMLPETVPPTRASDKTLDQPGSASAPEFEVSTVRPGNPNARSSNMNRSADGVEFTNLPLTFLLQFAYNLNAGSTDQIVDAPSWVSTTPFDINAKMEGKTAAAIDKLAPDQRTSALRRMVQTLLAERFQLKLHHESREMPVLALAIAKGGPKLTAASDPPPFDPNKPPKPGDWTGLHNQRGATEGRDEPVKLLVDALSSRSEIGGRLVVDETGLRGNYNFKLQWVPEGEPTSTNGIGQSGPSLFTALQEQLGLKLESIKAPVDVLVIDHIERPSPN